QVRGLNRQPAESLLEPLGGALKRRHRRRIPPARRHSYACRATCRSDDRGRLLIPGEPAAAIGAHVLDQGDQGLTLVGQLVRDPRRDLGVGATLDYPLPLQRPQAQRERAGADSLERALELTEAKRGVGEVADDEEGPLPRDDLRGATDGAALIEHGNQE